MKNARNAVLQALSAHAIQAFFLSSFLIDARSRGDADICIAQVKVLHLNGANYASPWEDKSRASRCAPNPWPEP
jgi:hypothetical protein